MNLSLPKVLACALVLFSFGQAEAKTFGGFKYRDTFMLKVTKVTSTKQVGLAGTAVASRIPANVPKFAKHKVISFKIGKRGNLTAKGGINIPFAHSSRTVNEYNLSKGGIVSITHTAEIDKRKGKATGGKLYFFITDTSGAEPVYYTVIYTLG